MCGIAGGISFRCRYFPNLEDIQNFSDCLRYRGPDAKGYLNFITNQTYVNFAHKRLRIIDLTRDADQPMQSVSGNSTIVFNGEIYNYTILFKELLNAGYHFKSHSDTEVLLNGFEAWGINGLLDRIDGMFAFALFDHSKNKLILARDPFGKKPLYYYLISGELAFSSDIRSFKLLKQKLTLNLHALGYYFSEMATPGNESIWNEINKLPPASYLSFSKDKVQINEYWKLTYSISKYNSRQEIIEKTDTLLSDAVKKKLVADVNVSALLSGGIDSSLIVGKMAKLKSKPVKTYSVGYNDEKFSELPFAKQVAEKYGTDHTEIILEANDLSKISEIIFEFGEPFSDPAMIPFYYICQNISDTEKVVLSGDGGDEIFGGYYCYYYAQKMDEWKSLRQLSSMVPKINHKLSFLKSVLQSWSAPLYILLNRNMVFSENQLKQFYDNTDFYKAVSKEHKKQWTNESRFVLQNLLKSSLSTRLLNDYLVKADRASMFASLEVRAPFLDKQLTEFASTIGGRDLLKNGHTKSILKELLATDFSHDFIYRKKHGFDIPIGNWLRNELKQEVKDTVLGGKQNLINLNYTFVEHIINEHNSGVIHDDRVWSLFVFHKWAQKW